jgi:hypothetical protein
MESSELARDLAVLETVLLNEGDVEAASICRRAIEAEEREVLSKIAHHCGPIAAVVLLACTT